MPYSPVIWVPVISVRRRGKPIPVVRIADRQSHGRTRSLGNRGQPLEFTDEDHQRNPATVTSPSNVPYSPVIWSPGILV